MSKGHFKDGVTRNKSTKCWLARIRRHKQSYSQYFFDNDPKFEGKDGARLAALKWYAEKLAVLPAKISTKNIKTRRNHSGVVGVHLSKGIQKKPSGAQYSYWQWVARWQGCPKRGGVLWRVNKYGEENAFVMAVLCRRMESIDSKEIHNAFLAAKASSEYQEILKLKSQTIPD